jgi:folate-binding protein YgfZ
MLSVYDPQYLVVEILGRDAERYLNARLTQNIKQLSIGQSCRTAALAPNGKTDLVLNIVRTSANCFLIICPNIGFSEFKKRLERYKVSDFFDLTDRSQELCCLYFFNPTTDLTLDQLQQSLSPANLTTNNFLADRLFGFTGIHYITDQTNAKIILSNGLELIDQAQAQDLRYIAHAPSFPQEINDAWLYIDNQDWSTISDQKGCYTGQEVVEKIRTLGKLPLILIGFECEPNFDPQNLILKDSASNKVGEICSFRKVLSKQKTYGFARIKPQFLVDNNTTIDHEGSILTLMHCYQR